MLKSIRHLAIAMSAVCIAGVIGAEAPAAEPEAEATQAAAAVGAASGTETASEAESTSSTASSDAPATEARSTAEPAIEPVGGANPVVSDDGFPRAEVIFPQLEPILREALTQSPRMLQENLALVASAYDRYVDKTVLYPSMGGYGQFNVQNEARANDSGSGGSSDSKRVAKTYYDVSLSQPLFHWGALKAQADIGRIRFQMSERNFRAAYQGLANEIRDAYLRLVVSKLALRNSDLGLKRSRLQLARAQQRVDEGRDVASVVTTLQYSIESQELARDRADVALTRSLELFQQMIGRPDFSLDQVPESIPALVAVKREQSMPLRKEYVTERTFEDDQRFFNATRSLAIQKRSLRITQVNLRPKFTLVAGVSQDEVDRTGNVVDKYQLATTYGGLRVNWPIFDSFRTRALVRAARARINSAQLGLQQLERDLIAGIEQSETELSFQTRSLAVAERNFTSAEGTYQSAIDFHKDGRFSQDEVDAARAALQSAEYSIAETRRAYLRTVSDFLALVSADPLVERLTEEGHFPR